MNESQKKKASDLVASTASISQALIDIAEDSASSNKDKVTALTALANVNGLMIKNVHVTGEIKHNVMRVPYIEPEDWETIALKSQSRLKALSEKVVKDVNEGSE